MSAWPEAIYTIKKVTADLLTKYNSVITSFTGVNAGIANVSQNLNTFSESAMTSIATMNGNLNTLNGNITNMNGNILLKHYIIASSTSGLTSNGFVSGAVCFINEE